MLVESWESVYEEALDDRVGHPLRADPAQLELWRRFEDSGYSDHSLLQKAAGRGLVGVEDNRERALWYTWTYQRRHLDIFGAVLNQHPEWWQGRDPLFVLDLGAGPGTVGLALHRCLSTAPSTPEKVVYVAVDHNAHQLDLAEALLGRVSARIGPRMDVRRLDRDGEGARSDPRVEALAATAWVPGAGRLLTANHVFNQPELTRDALHRWALLASDVGWRDVDERTTRGRDPWPHWRFIAAEPAAYGAGRLEEFLDELLGEPEAFYHPVDQPQYPVPLADLPVHAVTGPVLYPNLQPGLRGPNKARYRTGPPARVSAWWLDVNMVGH